MGQYAKIKMSTDTEIQETETENQYAQELYAQQAEQQMAGELQEVVTEGKTYQNPSKLKYGILFALAIIVDVADFAELTGLGWFVAKMVSIVSTVIILLIFFFTGNKQKQAKEYRKNLESMIENSVKNIAHAERIIIRTGKIARYVPWLSGVVKYVMAAAANLIPILDLAPWMVIGVYLSYRDESNTLKNARETAEVLEEEVAQQPEDTLLRRAYRFSKERISSTDREVSRQKTPTVSPEHKEEYDKAA